MPQRRALGTSGALLYRPLLGLSPVTFRTALAAVDQTWVEDPSNKDINFLRNRVRQRLLPGLGRARWPQTLERCGQLTRRLVSAIESETLRQVQEQKRTAVNGEELRERLRQTGGELVRLKPAAQLSPAALQAILALLGARLREAQAANALQRLQQQAAARPGRANRAGITVAGSALSLWLANEPDHAHSLVIWRTPNLQPQTLQVGSTGKLVVQLHHGDLEIAAPADSKLLMRGAAAGESLLLGNRERAAREVLRAAGVPRWARPSLPLLFEADARPERQRLLAVPRYLASTTLASSNPASDAANEHPRGTVTAWFRPN